MTHLLSILSPPQHLSPNPSPCRAQCVSGAPLNNLLVEETHVCLSQCPHGPNGSLRSSPLIFDCMKQSQHQGAKQKSSLEGAQGAAQMFEIQQFI